MGIKNYGVVSSIDELEEFCDRLIQGDGPIAFDLETGYLGDDTEKGALKTETNLLVGISFTNSTDWARYAPLGHDPDTGVSNLAGRAAARLLWPVLNTGRGVAHNATFELRNLARWFREQLADDPDHGEQVRASNGYFPILADTLVEAYLAAEFREFGLKALTKLLFGHTMTELHELFPGLAKNKRKYLRFNVLDLSPKVVEYACEDSAWCLAIHERYHPQVKDRLLYKVEHGVLTCVCEMEDYGVRYDWGYLRRGAEALTEFQSRFNAEIMDDLSQMLGQPTAINLGSWRQVGDTLYDKLGLVTTVYTSSTKDLPRDQRKMSTSATALAGLAKQYPVVRKIVQWKEMNKLLGTYLNKYERVYGGAPDGNTHPNHLSAFVITGRFAVSDPPYQQCVPGSYQVLTPSGWERLDKLADGTPVAQYHNDQSITFVVPEVVRNAYHGDMVELAGVELGTWRYTPNHRIVYRGRQPRGSRQLTDIRETTAADWREQLRQRPFDMRLGRRIHDRHIPCAGHLATAATELTEDEAQSLLLAVACQADGSRTNGHQYDICVYKERKVEMLRRLGYPPEQQSQGRWRVRVPVAAVDRWLDDTKNFRPDAILALHRTDLRGFVDQIMLWDGDAVRGATYGQKNCRRASVDVVQAAAALCGHATSLYERPEYDAVTVNIHPRAHRGSGRQWDRLVPSDGMVYCVTVPTGMFLCRNDEGHVQVTGNSPKKYHFDLREAADAHARGEDPPPGTCFKFNFRNAVVAPPEHYLLGFDLSQAELRAIAGEAQETALLAAFAAGEDVHSLTAALMLGIPVEEVTSDQRSVGKTMNFALLYGMGVKSLADRLALPRDEAQRLYDQYFQAYPAIAAWSAKQVAFGKANGYVTSRFGRRLPIWEFQSDKRWIYEKGERACVNYPIQGAATGDYVKIAMVRCRQALHRAGLADRVHLTMNVHDALEFAVHQSITDISMVIGVLEPAVIFDVPGWPAMKADWHVAKKWGSPMELDRHPDGRLFVRGAKSYELIPDMAEDEDTGEVGLVLPEDDVDAVHRALHLDAAQSAVSAVVADSPQPSAEPIQVTVTLADMPDEAGFERFIELLRANPGDNRITLSTPEGDLDLGTAAINVSHRAEIAYLLGEVEVTCADVDPHALVEGLTL